MAVLITDEQTEKLIHILEGKGDKGLADELREKLAPGSDDATYRAAAATQFATDDLEIDGDAIVSAADLGAWVQAWVWVSDSETGIEGADDGCPKGDPECLSRNGDCHDACEGPA